MSAVFAVCLAALSTGCFESSVKIYVTPDDGGTSTTVATQASTVVAGAVAASDYKLDFKAFSLVKNVDNVVQSESGYAQLVAGNVTGQDYAVHVGTLSVASTLAEVEAAYDGAATAGPLSALTTLQLPAAWFDLVGVLLDTTVERTVIIRNTDSGISSYQVLVISFY